jgi:acyl-CoA thioester hydrolase
LPPGHRQFSVILASLTLDYRAQTKYPENTTIIASTWLRHIGNSSFTFYCVLSSESGQTLCEGSAVIVHFNFEKEASEPLPEAVRSAFLPYLEQDLEQGGKA